MALSGPWRLESQNPEAIPLSGAHIWNSPFLAGHSVTFQSCRCLLKKCIHNDRSSQYHLGTFCIKFFSTCILDFTLVVNFLWCCLLHNSNVFWKLLADPHGDVLDIGKAQGKLKFHHLPRLLLWAISEHLPDPGWVLYYKEETWSFSCKSSESI